MQAIAMRLLSIQASAPGVIRMRVNPFKLPEIVSGFERLGIWKPFFRGSEKFVYDSVLSNELALLRILPSTWLVGPRDEQVRTLFWAGSGLFAGRSGVLAPDLGFEGEAPRMVALIMNIEPVFAQLSDLLQSPEVRLDLL